MRTVCGVAVLLGLVPAILVIDGWGREALAGKALRLAQTSTLTTCMMNCNSQAASCRIQCVMPNAPLTTGANATGNVSASTVCQLACSTQQVSCQTTCAQNSPSQ